MLLGVLAVSAFLSWQLGGEEETSAESGETTTSATEASQLKTGSNTKNPEKGSGKKKKKTPQAILPVSRDASDAFFERSEVTRIDLRISQTQLDFLREDARRYVRGNLIENRRDVLTDVAIKLKGAAGSFQELDGKPAFTINTNKFLKGQTFHALRKLHLNNSVQDETYTCEWLCSQICRDLGIPAARVSHARVFLNDRDLGMYVVKEGFDESFLRRHFLNYKGNLYDGGFCQEIDGELEKDYGRGPDDRRDLRKLVEVCQESDPQIRREKLEKLLDVPAFIKFMAFELMAGHWDGYVGNKNNYRMYFDPQSKRAYFMPHGMDQVFQDPNFPVFVRFPTLVAEAVRGVDDWNAQYRTQVGEIAPFFAADKLLPRVQALHRRIRPAVQELGSDAVVNFDEQCRGWADRLREREQSIAWQLTQPDPPPEQQGSDQPPEEIVAIEPVELVNGWFTMSESGDAQHAAEPAEPPGENEQEREGELAGVYTITVGESQDCIASFRKRVRIQHGQYRFAGWARVENVVPREGDDRGVGAGLRISGARRELGLVGTQEWRELDFVFDCLEESEEVTLVVELRASGGKALFRGPFTLHRIGDVSAVAE